jgi:hypothetical protein
MRFYTKQHPFYCGIDLHARTMYVCILDQAGETLVHRNMPATPEALLKAIAPYREQIVLAAECMFTWYWLADLCADHGIPFVLGHALYMKAIHSGKGWCPTSIAQQGRSAIPPGTTCGLQDLRPSQVSAVPIGPLLREGAVFGQTNKNCRSTS